MRITEAVAALAVEYPMYSKSKVKAALKIEMEKAPDVEGALNNARKVIDGGALAPSSDARHSDPTGNEVQTRVGKSDLWKAANPIGYMATKGARPGMTDIEIAAADRLAEEGAELWRAS